MYQRVRNTSLGSGMPTSHPTHQKLIILSRRFILSTKHNILHGAREGILVPDEPSAPTPWPLLTSAVPMETKDIRACDAAPFRRARGNGRRATCCRRHRSSSDSRAMGLLGHDVLPVQRNTNNIGNRMQ